MKLSPLMKSIKPAKSLRLFYQLLSQLLNQRLVCSTAFQKLFSILNMESTFSTAKNIMMQRRNSLRLSKTLNLFLSSSRRPLLVSCKTSTTTWASRVAIEVKTEMACPTSRRPVLFTRKPSAMRGSKLLSPLR